MSSSEYSNTDRLSLDPDNMTDEELLQVSLFVLTRNVSPSLPDYSVILLFSQWLDIHRRNPTAFSLNWMHTTQQWVHALRSRGCSSADIIHGLDVWKHISAKIGPGCSQSRALPTSEEVVLWYGTQVVLNSQPTRRVDNNSGHGNPAEAFMGPPPGTYICNRCGVPGHHVQVCPTNLNPAFDKAPGDTYTCTICHLQGGHFRSLCPYNSDPLSLTQQRGIGKVEAVYDNKAVYNNVLANQMTANAGTGFYAGYNHHVNQYGISQVSNRHPNPWNDPGFMKMNEGPAPLFGAVPMDKDLKVNNRIMKNGKRGRQLSSTPSRSSNEGSPTPDKKQSLRKRIKRIEVYEDKLAKGKTLATTQIEMIQKKEDIQNELNALDENDSGEMGEMGKMRGGELRVPDHGARPSFSSESSGLDSLASLGNNLPKTPSSSMRVVSYNEFTQKLVQCRRDEMTAVVNVMKPRATALQKWELARANHRNLLDMAARGVDISSDPFLDGQAAARRPAMAVAQSNNPVNYSAHNYHGAGHSLARPRTPEFPYKPFPITRPAPVKTSQNSLLDDSDEFLPSLAQRGRKAHAGRFQTFDKVIAPPAKPFDKVIAPPSKLFDKVIAPPTKASDKVMAPPAHSKLFCQVMGPPAKTTHRSIAPLKRVPKDISNLPKRAEPKEPESPFTRACRMIVASPIYTDSTSPADAEFVAGRHI